MTSFVLAEQPWIPCTQQDGSVVELSTHDALARAHELRGVVDASPLVTAVLHRHLLAVLHRSYDGPRSMSEWVAIAGASAFDMTRVGSYLERVRERLDLFHATAPFAQTPGLRELFPDRIDPIDALEIEGSSFGSASSVFAHTRDGAPFTPGRAARALLAHQAFATGGLVKKPGEPTSATAAPLVRSAVVLLRRETLFLTLVSNLLVMNREASEPVPAAETDRPSWETDGLPRRLKPESEPKVMPTGWLHMLTWLSRRIELVHDGSRVTGWVRAVGVGVADGAPIEPMVGYREDEKRGLVPLGVDPDRAFWRDAGAIFTAAGEHRRYRRSRALDLVAKPAAKAVLGGDTARYQVELLGLAAEKSKINAARAERLETIAAVLGDPDAREAVEHALRVSEQAVSALQSALLRYARFALTAGDRDPDKEAVRNLARSLAAEPAAWSALGVAFATFVRALEGDRDVARRRYERDVREVIERRFAAAIAASGNTGGTLKATAHAERSLRRHLAAVPWTQEATASAPPAVPVAIEEPRP